ncbi:homologous pairing protein, putative [Pediculus humanus corporis]|uniref:Homologous pairing protein, putative n=1 Tax=Pediculus humanus subsp. corporis TaxID=121224 RepID=E0VR35_PEDHC|nr:homologous pairing protein, putative [Pediculus humanus corporis]EEB15841.1 homologous pairing protein, putative [Pediculus humanus corporis]
MASNNNCEESVLDYLRRQNRPYSVVDIVQNLRNEFSRVAVQKALDDLSLKKVIKEKVYGKQKVYSFMQSDENDSIKEIQDLDREIITLTTNIEKLEQEFKISEAELKNLLKEPTTQDALLEKIELEETIRKMENEVENTIQPSLEEFSEEEKNQLDKQYEKYLKEYKIHAILEGYPKKAKYLIEEIGIEMDDDDNDNIENTS